MTPEQRSRCMAAIRGKDTKPEILVRKFLFSKGLRYRLNNRKLPGSPDIVLKNTRPSYSLTVAFGMAMKDASISGCPKATLRFGRLKLRGTSNATRRQHKP